MLKELKVRDLALVAESTVRFGAGLNLLTGETGSGKSLIVDSLSLALGVRNPGGWYALFLQQTQIYGSDPSDGSLPISGGLAFANAAGSAAHARVIQRGQDRRARCHAGTAP